MENVQNLPEYAMLRDRILVADWQDSFSRSRRICAELLRSLHSDPPISVEPVIESQIQSNQPSRRSIDCHR